MPGDVAVDSISDYPTEELNRLKEWPYRKRTQVREDSERAERRRKKEQEIARRKAEQPALFEFLQYRLKSVRAPAHLASFNPCLLDIMLTRRLQ